MVGPSTGWFSLLPHHYCISSPSSPSPSFLVICHYTSYCKTTPSVDCLNFHSWKMTSTDTSSDNDLSRCHVINCGKFETAHFLQPPLITTNCHDLLLHPSVHSFTSRPHVSWPHLIASASRQISLLILFTSFHLTSNWCSMMVAMVTYHTPPKKTDHFHSGFGLSHLWPAYSFKEE